MNIGLRIEEGSYAGAEDFYVLYPAGSWRNRWEFKPHLNESQQNFNLVGVFNPCPNRLPVLINKETKLS
ncbi:hypothetical protein H6G36_30100 [Anabaena minutissima FACHB-250]|nr:hypothetical protein [Anabaena minutissima FACHB-250]